MRIAGEIAHPRFKITLFKMNTRWSVKIEDGMLEQTYKFRMQDGLQSAEAVKGRISAEFLDAVGALFEQMERMRSGLLPEPGEGAEDFPEII